MTFKEKLAQERPDCIDDEHAGGCMYCPSDYGYEGPDEGLCKGNWVGGEGVCRACWDREMPLTPEEQERHDLEINAEIIRGYCNKFTCGECPAGDVCRDEPGMWSDGWSYTSAKKQRSMLDAFEAALPVEENMTHPVRRRIPESVRDLIDSRIISIDNQIKFLQSERQELVDFWNGK